MTLYRGAWLLALLVGGCDVAVCRAKTLYLTVDYAPAAAAADALAVDVTVAGTARHFVQPRTPGRTRDTLEVDFAAYPAQAAVVIAATAMNGGQSLASGETTGTLAPSCTALSVALTTLGGGSDGGGSDGGGMLPSDAAPAGPDLRDPVNVGDLAWTTPPMDLAAADLASSSTDMTVTTPVVVFSGETDTELHPNGSSGTLPFDTHCTAGQAIVGFAYAVSSSNGVTTGINRADALCVQPLLTPKAGGGFTVAWDPNHASQIPGLGTSDPVTIQYLCQMPNFLVGFAGRATATALDDLVYSCAPIEVSASDVVSLGTVVNGTAGVGSTTNGTAFGPVYCPAGQVATSVISSGQTGSPPVSFGFGCSTMSAQ
jgi:hypothetical protein